MINEAEIHRKSRSHEVNEREEAAYELGSDFAGFSDRVQAWTTFESTLLHSQAASERLIRAVVGGVGWR